MYCTFQNYIKLENTFTYKYELVKKLYIKVPVSFYSLKYLRFSNYLTFKRAI